MNFDLALSEFYINYSINKEHKQSKYLSNLFYFNLQTFDKIPLKYDLVSLYKKDYYFVKSLFAYFDRKCNNCIPVFITITLPSFYHNFDKFTEGYNKLQSFLRTFYKNISTYKVRYKYIRIIEPHKDFTPHLHALIYLDLSETSLTYAYVRNIFYRLKKRAGLGRSQFVRIQGTKGVQKYVSKYLVKMFDTSDLRYLYALDGWKRYHKIRLITYSKVEIPKYIFKKLISYVDLPDDFDFDNYDDYYHYFLQNTFIVWKFSGIDEYLRTYGNFYNSSYVVIVELSRKVKYSGFVPFFTRDELRKHFYNISFSSRLDKILSFMNKTKDDYMIYLEKIDTYIFDENSFFDDLFYYYVEEYSYVYISDLYIFDKNFLVFKKSDNFLCRDLR